MILPPLVFPVLMFKKLKNTPARELQLLQYIAIITENSNKEHYSCGSLFALSGKFYK
jgi:hypothetical protein